MSLSCLFWLVFIIKIMHCADVAQAAGLDPESVRGEPLASPKDAQKPDQAPSWGKKKLDIFSYWGTSSR